MTNLVGDFYFSSFRMRSSLYVRASFGSFLVGCMKKLCFNPSCVDGCIFNGVTMCKESDRLFFSCNTLQ